MELGLGQIFRSLNTKTQFQAFLKAFRNPSLLVGYSDNLKKKKGKGCGIWACFSIVLDQLWTCVLAFFLSFGQTILHKLLLLCGVFPLWQIKTSTYKEVWLQKWV
jgi:hypothetical protein